MYKYYLLAVRAFVSVRVHSCVCICGHVCVMQKQIQKLRMCTFLCVLLPQGFLWVGSIPVGGCERSQLVGRWEMGGVIVRERKAGAFFCIVLLKGVLEMRVSRVQ